MLSGQIFEGLPFAACCVYAETMDKSEVLSTVRNAAKGVLRQGLDIVLPPRDPFRDSDESEWAKISFLDEPCCAQCGFPFEYDMGEGMQCAGCLARPPRYSSARSAMIYDEASRPFILSFKHGGKTDNLARFAAQLSRAGRGFLKDADYIIPVPLHNKRRIQRRYNQSALLARALAKITIAEFDPDLLRRTRHTMSQGGQSAKGRRRNVRGAFAVPIESKPRIAGAHIVIIDDVMTTGATVEACASILLRSGAKRVDVLCIARVVRTDINQKENIYGQS